MATKAKAQRTANGLLDTRKLMEQYVYGSSRFMEIPVANLKIDMSYQREQSETLVQKIVSRFDLNKFEPPTVNARPDGSYYVVDGGHRVEAARRLGIKALTCRIIQIAPGDEPEYFIELNRSRRWVTPVQTFKAEVANKNPAALVIERCLDERHIRVSASRTPNTLSCTSALHDVYARRGESGLCTVLDAALLWPEDEPRRFAGQLIRGLDLFFHEFQKNADPDRFRLRLAATSTGLILSRASARWHAWQAVDQRGGSLIDATAEEIQKAYLRR